MTYEQKRSVKGKPNPPAGSWSVSLNRPDGYADYQIGMIYIAADKIKVLNHELRDENNDKNTIADIASRHFARAASPIRTATVGWEARASRWHGSDERTN